MLQLGRMTLFMQRTLTTIESKSFIQMVNLRQNVEDFSEPGLKGDSSGSFNVATAIEVDVLGQVFVAEFYYHRIQVFTDEGDFLVEFGSQGSVPGEFERPTDMTVDSKGNIYVEDFGNNRIQKFASLISQTKNE